MNKILKFAGNAALTLGAVAGALLIIGLLAAFVAVQIYGAVLGLTHLLPMVPQWVVIGGAIFSYFYLGPVFNVFGVWSVVWIAGWGWAAAVFLYLLPLVVALVFGTGAILLAVAVFTTTFSMVKR